MNPATSLGTTNVHMFGHDEPARRRFVDYAGKANRVVRVPFGATAKATFLQAKRYEFAGSQLAVGAEIVHTPGRKTLPNSHRTRIAHTPFSGSDAFWMTGLPLGHGLGLDAPRWRIPLPLLQYRRLLALSIEAAALRCLNGNRLRNFYAQASSFYTVFMRQFLDYALLIRRMGAHR